MITYGIICISLSLFYAGMMLLYWYHWKKCPEYPAQPLTDWPNVSVVIPVRDEAANIGYLLGDLLALNYPEKLLEIIIVDDHSEDNTPEIVKSFADNRIRLIYLKDWLKDAGMAQAYKKRAIETGIAQAAGDMIMTTDGDCRVGKEWVRSMVVQLQQSGSRLVTGPVVFKGEKTLFEKFQTLDFLGMMGITAASLRMGIYNMANGANLLFEKSAFNEVEGYKGIDTVASGDDMLLVYKIASRYDGAVSFAKSRAAVVSTAPMHHLSGFLQQRFRWTAKSKDYQDKRVTVILGLVYLSVLFLLINALLVCWMPELGTVLLFQLGLKFLVDIPLLYNTSAYFRKSYLMRTYLSSQIMHILYIVGVGTLGNILKYEWKGRVLKK